MAYLFVESYYIASRLAQLKANGEVHTEDDLRTEIRLHGETPKIHYEKWGRAEGLNPNPYFNENEYLAAKLNQLQQTEPKKDWTMDSMLAAITDAGMTPVEHYERYGAFETDAHGNFINPSNAFDANAYYSAKLYQLHRTEPDKGWTLETMLDAFEAAGLSAVSHYAEYGAVEANNSGIAFVQTVPASQRVPNDPARDAATGDIAPTNYLDATPAPTDNNARPAQDPADVGSLANDAVSPPAVRPVSSAPYDDMPPSTIMEGEGVTILPPSNLGVMFSDRVGGQWAVVADGSDTAVVVADNGTILGMVPVIRTENADGTVTMALDASEGLLASELPVVDGIALPQGLTVDAKLANKLVPGIHFGQAADGDGVNAFGVIPDTASASFAIGDDGAVVSGNNASASGVILGAGGMLDASSVTGNGTLTIDTTAFSSAHAIKGSMNSANIITADRATDGVAGGNKADLINISGDASMRGAIDGGAGADTVIVASGVRNVELLQDVKDSGTFAATAGSSLGTGSFDVFSLSAGTLSVRGYEADSDWAGGLVAQATLNFAVGNNEAYYVKGVYDGGAKTFTANAGGSDFLVAYDSSAGAAVTAEAVVIVGINEIAANVDGGFDLT